VDAPPHRSVRRPRSPRSRVSRCSFADRGSTGASEVRERDAIVESIEEFLGEGK